MFLVIIRLFFCCCCLDFFVLDYFSSGRDEYMFREDYDRKVLHHLPLDLSYNSYHGMVGFLKIFNYRNISKNCFSSPT